jgi:hypothetical protein
MGAEAIAKNINLLLNDFLELRLEEKNNNFPTLKN